MWPFDVTIPHEIGMLQVLSIFYSYSPGIVLLAGGLYCVWVRRSHALALFCFPLAAFVINELALKRLISRPRPGAKDLLTDYNGRHVGSCALSCGMPSSHSTICIGSLVLLVLDAGLRIRPRHADACEAMDAGQSCIGCAPQGTWTPRQFVFYMAFWVVMLLPVPLARVILYDHSVSQVVLGSSFGAVLAFLWLATWEKSLFFCRLHLGSRVFGGCIFHDYMSAMETADGVASGVARGAAGGAASSAAGGTAGGAVVQMVDQS